MASTMIRPIARISSGPNPRDVVAGVPSRMPGRRVRRQRIERDGVLVDRDPDLVEEVLRLLAGHAERGHVDQHEVVVGPARHDPRAHARPASSARIAALLDGPPLILPERLLGGQLEGDGLARDDVHQRPALVPGKTFLSIEARERALDRREVRRVHAPAAARTG